MPRRLLVAAPRATMAFGLPMVGTLTRGLHRARHAGLQSGLAAGSACLRCGLAAPTLHARGHVALRGPPSDGDQEVRRQTIDQPIGARQAVEDIFRDSLGDGASAAEAEYYYGDATVSTAEVGVGVDAVAELVELSAAGVAVGGPRPGQTARAGGDRAGAAPSRPPPAASGPGLPPRSSTTWTAGSASSSTTCCGSDSLSSAGTSSLVASPSPLASRPVSRPNQSQVCLDQENPPPSPPRDLREARKINVGKPTPRPDVWKICAPNITSWGVGCTSGSSQVCAPAVFRSRG
ncbi:unnamed protein product [Prorocentrum cordatum]|uniref:Uncharacterized protein n=1 Tax=Prorocentrum cordatum TaxID=2364126 RepID=A0ABN9XG97_9DINO|nr:unnamed protein product [Polarella glacialis]